MAAASADLIGLRVTTNVDKVGGVIKDTNQMYVDAFGALDLSSGYFVEYTGAAGQVFLGRNHPAEGWAFGKNGIGAGDQSATNKNFPQVACQGTPELRLGVSVTGTAAVTDTGKPVFASDDQTLTLTRPARGNPVGMVAKWYTGTTCDVLMFGAVTQLAINLGGNGAQSVLALFVNATDLTTATGYQIQTPPCRGRLRSFSATVYKALAGGTSITLQPQIKLAGGSFVSTTGSVTNLTTNATGAVVAVQTVTHDGNDIFDEDSTIQILVTLSGAYTAGSFCLYMTYDNNFGV